MNSPAIELTHHDLVATVTIARPAQQNALDTATLNTLQEVFTAIKNDNAVRVVILTGAGEQAFSMGTDVAAFAMLLSQQASEYARLGQTLTDLIEDLGKPVIAAINGLAYGSGCELALACTWRIAVAHAQFAWSEARLGIIGEATRLARVIGKARALELLLTGRPIDADEALRIGLINRVAKDQSELLTICHELATQISRNAPLAIKYALEAVNHGAALPLAEGLQLEATLFASCFATEDAREGTQAFLEKRAPVFKGQ